MKVIKRDGRAVEYEKTKIEKAIEKANNEVRDKEKATKEEIKDIIDYIEDLGKKRMLVEDIQDIIEQKLMEIGKFELAKKYIVYRYTRALIRKQNTTDESIMSIIKNSNKNLIGEKQDKKTIVASAQRDLIAGEVSKDLTKRVLLPDKISKAHGDGILYFHGADYFLQPIPNTSIINISDMLERGTVINGILVETPESFLEACTVTAQIILEVASSQYGEETLDISILGKYLRKSKENIKLEIQKLDKNNELSKDMLERLVEQRLNNDLNLGIKIIEYQINTQITANGKLPEVIFILNPDKNDEYREENIMILNELLKQQNAGMKDENGKNIIQMYPKICEDKEEKYKLNGLFNQGMVSINLPQIGLISGNNEEKFWGLLNERLELCKEALMCRHYALLGTLADTSPIHWRYGAIARLDKGEKIDKLLKNGYSTISLGYIGLCETVRAVKGEVATVAECKEFENKIIKFLNKKINQWIKETGIGFYLENKVKQDVCASLVRIDKERFGIIQGVTDKEYYTNE